MKLTIIWEHDYNDKVKQIGSLNTYWKKRKQYYQDITVYGHINLRERLFGGRTNNLFFHYKCKDDEILYYFDFTSLYPYVLVNRFYPIGHPKVITQDFEEIDRYFGFIKCIILPPKKLYLPVLPVRINKKLYFPLCMVCAENKVIESCSHGDTDRALVGTWTSMEIQKPLKCGYKIVRIIEVLHYEQKSSTNALSV